MLPLDMLADGSTRKEVRSNFFIVDLSFFFSLLMLWETNYIINVSSKQFCRFALDLAFH